MRSFKSNENIHKKEGGSYYVVSANKASSVTHTNTSKSVSANRTAEYFKAINIPDDACFSQMKT